MIPAGKQLMINSKRKDPSALAVYRGDTRPIGRLFFLKPAESQSKNEIQ